MSDGRKSDFTILKIAAGVVLGLLIWNAIESYQQRKAAEAAIAEFRRIAEDPDPLGWRASAQRQQAARRPSSQTSVAPKPVPPGFRCMDGALLKKIEGGWTQITSRNNELYCPPGGTVQDCYRVTERSVGCR